MNDKSKERPIIIPRPEMVRAILEDRKTLHRWPIKPQPELDLSRGWWWKGKCYGMVASLYGNKLPVAKLIQDMKTACPYQVRDILWVRETCAISRVGDVDGAPLCGPVIIYKADGYPDGWESGYIQRPSIFMPKWASRIKLEVIKVRVERIQDISGQDVLCEGINSHVHPTADYFDRAQREAFERIWNSIWAKKGFGWDTNCWVWAIEFKRIENE